MLPVVPGENDAPLWVVAVGETPLLDLVGDLLIIDAHFAEAEKDAFAGWGHSCREDDLAMARAAGIPRVLLGHHAPNADDKTLLAAEEQVRKLSSGALLARAGQWLTICG